jgi:hypothetical protein
MRDIIVREIPSMKLKKCFMKGCQIFVAYMEEPVGDQVKSIEYHPILKYFEDVFRDIPRFPLKRDIDFSIDLM